MNLRQHRRRKYAMLERLARTPLWARPDLTIWQRLAAVSRQAASILQKLRIP